jgi:hypothetical protein
MQREEPLFTSNLKRHPASTEGITCIVCHRVDRNYGKVSGRTAIVEGNVYDAVFGPKGGEILKKTIASNPNLKPDDKSQGQQKIHKDALKFDPITSSAFCGTCHDVNLLNGFRLEEAFTQFKNSPAAKNNTNCQDCHMGKVPGAKVAEGEKNYAIAAQTHQPYVRWPGLFHHPHRHVPAFEKHPRFALGHAETGYQAGWQH